MGDLGETRLGMYIKNINQRLINKKPFEQHRYQDLSLPEHQEGRIEPCQTTVEERKERDLRKISKGE